MVDVLLIDPPYRSLKGVMAESAYPMALVELGAWLEKHDISVAVLSCDLLAGIKPSPVFDFDVESYARGQRSYAAAVGDPSHWMWGLVNESIQRLEPKLIGISCLTPAKESAYRVAGCAKAALPECTVVLGGHHPTFCTEEVLEQEAVDYVIRGEGEVGLLELARQTLAGGVAPEQIPGLAMSGDLAPTVNPIAPLVASLDELPLPARHLLVDCDYETFSGHLAGSARGCPYVCSFCSDRRLWGGKVRRRCPMRLIQDLKHLEENYEPGCVDMVDGTFTFDKKYLKEFADLYTSEGLSVKWRCTARYDNIDEEMLGWLKKTNCSGLYFGLESGSPDILKSVSKNTTVEGVLAASRLVRESGIMSITSILMGLPEERERDLEQTLELMSRIHTDLFDINCYVPLPGTAYYDLMTQEEKDRVDWATAGYKSFDNDFNKHVPREKLRGYLDRAYQIAGETMQRLRQKMATT